MVTEYNGSRSLRRVGKCLPNYELLITGDCQIRENPKSHNIQSFLFVCLFVCLGSLQHWILLNTYAAAGDGLQNQKQSMCAANPCPVFYGKI